MYTALLDVEPAEAINFDLVVGTDLETSLLIRNNQSKTVVFKVHAKLHTHPSKMDRSIVLILD